MKNKGILILIVLFICFCSCKYFDKCKGDCENGYGRIEYLSGSLEGDIYEGYFKNGVFNGKGKYYSQRLDMTLNGQYKNGLPDGICNVYFGENSNWVGTYTGNWENGINKDFFEYISKTKDDKHFLYFAAHFLDTILYFYNYSNIQNIIDLSAKIHKRDLTKDKIPTEEIITLIDSLKLMEIKLKYALEQIDTFMEYDPKIPFKQVTIEYLTAFSLFFENEYRNWLLFIQHNPDVNKPLQIWENLRPFAERIDIVQKEWVSKQEKFRKKFDV